MHTHFNAKHRLVLVYICANFDQNPSIDMENGMQIELGKRAYWPTDGRTG